MPQEFLASFTVDIDEAGVSRLQTILNQNREMAAQVSSAFDKARFSMEQFFADYEQGSLNGLISFLHGGFSSSSSASSAPANASTLSARDSVKKALTDAFGSVDDGSERGYTLSNLLYSTIAMATKNSADLRNLPTREVYGLTPDPTRSAEEEENYQSYSNMAQEILQEPIAKARETMQRALDAEAEGLDPTEYVEKVIETLREPLQQVQELYDSMTPEQGPDSSSGSGQGSQADAVGTKNVRDLVKNTLLDEFGLNDGTERGFTLDSLLLSTVAQGTRNATDLRNLPKRSDYGLSPGTPAYEDSEDYSSFQYQASELLRQPIAEARDQMQHALDAESEGVDPSEYVNKVIETLRQPLQQVQELYDSFNFESNTSGESKGFDLSDMSARVDSFLKDTARKRLMLSADASDIVSKVNAAVNEARSIVNNANLKLKVQTETEDGSGSSGNDGGVVGSLFSSLKLSTGGRFTSPTQAEIAEDGGTEYVIPVNREDRAVPLVRSLLSELSDSARETLHDAMGSSTRVIPQDAVRGVRDGDSVRGARVTPWVDGSSSVASVTGQTERGEGSPFAAALADLPGLMSGAIASAAPVSVVNQPVSNQNVSAPVNIRVEATATDPEAVGRSIYNTAERYLLRTLQTVG